MSCTPQGVTLSVYADRVSIERSSSSMFDDKQIPMGEVRGVDFTGGS